MHYSYQGTTLGSQVQSNIEILDFRSKILERDLRFYIYSPNLLLPLQSHHLLYMHDGQNLFSAKTAYRGSHWGLKETLDQLISMHYIPPLTVVGIGSDANRFSDYAALRDPDFRGGAGGGGGRFEESVISEICPAVERRLKFEARLGSRAVGGASLGALSSLSLGGRFPGYFTKFMLMSPSLFWANAHWLSQPLDMFNGTRLWLDVGDKEESFPGCAALAVKNFHFFSARLKKLAPAAAVKQMIGVGHKHDEIAWGSRAARALKFLYPEDQKT